MAKDLKFGLKNAQLAKAVKLDDIKAKLADTKSAAEKSSTTKKVVPVKKAHLETKPVESKSVPIKTTKKITPAKKIVAKKEPSKKIETPKVVEEPIEENIVTLEKSEPVIIVPIFTEEKKPLLSPAPVEEKKPLPLPAVEEKIVPKKTEPFFKLGPTGKHINDFLPIKKAPPPPPPPAAPVSKAPQKQQEPQATADTKPAAASKPTKRKHVKVQDEEDSVDGKRWVGNEQDSKANRPRIKEFRDVKPLKKRPGTTPLKRGRNGSSLEGEGEVDIWTKRRIEQQAEASHLIRPAQLQVRLPISIKDLASAMKLKASQLISKLFMQGITVTLNDILDDETTVQLLGQEFGCEVSINTTEEKRIQITGLSIQEEIATTASENLMPRGPIITFMGHVDHGKTSLIDKIRKTHVAAGEAGAITQHIGAFSVPTSHGKLTILDTPGHEAFSAMRARGAVVTDIAVLVIAGDEGMKAQSIEAIQHAKTGSTPIVVAINKCDKPGFNVENVYRQLAENDLLPEAWGGTIITVNCSAKTGEGIDNLLEMLALQAEVQELKANPNSRARGTVLESEMHKGLGAVATLLIQNGSLHKGDAIVFDDLWGRVKTMRNEEGKELDIAGPSTPVEVTGLSGLPQAGHEFIVVSSEKEARNIAETRQEDYRNKHMLQKKPVSMEHLLQDAKEASKKELNLILRADMQGSLEALKASLQKVQSEKIRVHFILSGIGEISESDVELAATSKAVIIGFHTNVESHAESIIKQYGVVVKLFDIIYHCLDAVKELMLGTLDKIAEEQEQGQAEVKAIFKASQLGLIAGCLVTSGSIARHHHARIKRGNEQVWKGSIESLKREKDDVREVQKGFECGILLKNYNQLQVGDRIETYEIVYHAQDL